MKPTIEYKVISGGVMSNETEGASDLDSCPTRTFHFRCRCEPKCSICGYGEHYAIHGPISGHPAGSKPWGHRFTTQKPIK